MSNHKLVEGDVRVTLDDECNEGWCGDYDPDDPEDEPLLRFSVERLIDGQWESVDNGSFCTCLPTTAAEKVVADALRCIMSSVYENVVAGTSIKKTCERLSWLGWE